MNDEYKELQRLTKTHQCGQCKGMLATAWIDGGFKHRCSCKNGPAQLERIMTYADAMNLGIPIPIHVQNRLENKIERKTMARQQLAKATGTQIAKSNASLFGGLTEEGSKKVAVELVKAGFNPAIHLDVYHGKPLVNSKGAYWWATQRKDVEFGSISSVPIKSEEDRKAYGLKPHHIGVLTYLYVKDARILPDGTREAFCSGFGMASTDPRNPVINGSAVESRFPFRMAEKRAEMQAIFKFHPQGSTWANVATEEVDDAIPATYSISESEDMSCPIHEGSFFEKKPWAIDHLVVGEKGPKGGKVWCTHKEAWDKYHDAQSKAQDGQEEGSETKSDVQE